MELLSMKGKHSGRKMMEQIGKKNPEVELEAMMGQNGNEKIVRNAPA